MEKISKNSILIYAKKIRDIQKNQLDPYIELIECELRKLYPDLIDEKDPSSIEDWACDIINQSDSIEVNSVLNRIESILDEKTQNNTWVCKYCNKSTKDVDYDYLNGTDHLSCIFENESKNDTPLNSTAEIRNQLARMQDIITQLESRLSRIETQSKNKC